MTSNAIKLKSSLQLTMQATYPLGVCLVNGTKRIIEMINDRAVMLSPDTLVNHTELETAKYSRGRYEISINNKPMYLKPLKLSGNESLMTKEQLSDHITKEYENLYTRHKQGAITMFIILTNEFAKLVDEKLHCSKGTLELDEQKKYLSDCILNMEDKELVWNTNQELAKLYTNFTILSSNGKYLVNHAQP